MKKGILITREKGNEIIREHMDKHRECVTMCYKGQWYDVRGMNEKERWELISDLISK